MAFLEHKLLIICNFLFIRVLLKQCSFIVCENPRSRAFKKSFCLIFLNLKLKPLTVFVKSSMLDVWPGSKCISKVKLTH